MTETTPAQLSEVLRQILSPRQVEAERDLCDAEDRIRTGHAMKERADRNLADIQSAIANPVRFYELSREFVAALKSDGSALDAFLNAAEDNGMRGLLFAMRVDAEFGARRERRAVASKSETTE